MNDIEWFDGPLAQVLVSPSGDVGRDMARRAVRVESAAKSFASGRPGPRVISGRLRGSIRWVPGDAAGAFVVSVQVVADTGAVATIGSDVEYSGYVEQGTSRARPYPYLRPALAAGA